MNKISTTSFFIYPIKSTFRISLNESEVEFTGLKYDRHFAIINKKNKIITGRENQQLLRIRTVIDNGTLTLFTPEEGKITISLLDSHKEERQVGIFSDQTFAEIINHELNDWLSNILGESVQLVKVNEKKQRKMKSKHNGKENDFIGFQDASAIHLITASSLQNLNEQLEKPVSIHHFRPNIVLKGTKPYEEDHWKRVKIGACEFEVAIKTARCAMITINPETVAKDKQQEPLKTLAKLRKEQNKVNFGIYLIPRKIGKMRVGDEVVID